MRTGIVVLCRYNSSRLPGKILKTIGGRPILQIILDRLQCLEFPIVVATSTEKDDDPIAEYCLTHHVECFRGSLKDVAGRFLSAAENQNFEFAVRINGDNALIDLDVLQQMIKQTEVDNLDFNSNVKGRTYPTGMSIEIVKRSFFKEVYDRLKDDEHKEHVTLYLYHNENLGDRFYTYNDEILDAHGLKLAVDTQEDFDMISSLYLSLPDVTNYNLKTVVSTYNRMNKTIWKGKHGPLLIAEIGGNHEGDFDYAKKLTKLAIEADVDFIKYQIYTGDTLVNPIENPVRNEHFKKFELGKDQYRELAGMCRAAGIGFMASIWNPEFVDWVDEFSDIYKIGSGDFTAYPIIEQFVSFGKPLLLSCGLSNMSEVTETVKFIQELDSAYKSPEMLALLQCTSMYPIPFSAANLSTMQKFKESLKIPIGYSDHTEGFYALEIAVAMGAEILEFHFTDSREGKTFRDHKVSLTRDDVCTLISRIRDIRDLKGDGIKRCLEEEKVHLVTFRRALYLNRDINSGEAITRDDIVALRPNHGIDARAYRKLIGKTTRRLIRRFEKLTWEDFN